MATHSTTASVGTTAPKLALPDEGNLVTLDGVLEHGPVVLVFLRGFA